MPFGESKQKYRAFENRKFLVCNLAVIFRCISLQVSLNYGSPDYSGINHVGRRRIGTHYISFDGLNVGGSVSFIISTFSIVISFISTISHFAL